MTALNLKDGVDFSRAEVADALLEYAIKRGAITPPTRPELITVRGLGSRARRETGCMLRLQINAALKDGGE